MHFRIEKTGRRVLVASAVVVAGAAVAVTAASAASTPSTHPITVCVNKADRTVTEPSDGHCKAHSQQTVHLASAHDVVTLAHSVAALQSGLASQRAALTQLRGMFRGELVLTAQPDNTSDFFISARGQLLRPNAKVKLHATDDKDSTTSATVATVDQTGHVTVDPIPVPCGTTDLYFTSVDLNGVPISTTHQLSGPGCP
jgi:hypothetical protein